jgi:hypothetical protein
VLEGHLCDGESLQESVLLVSLQGPQMSLGGGSSVRMGAVRVVRSQRGLRGRMNCHWFAVVVFGDGSSWGWTELVED